MKKAIGILFIVILCILSVGRLGNATTFHSGSITTEETWDPGGNPHIITSNLWIQEGGMLTILPGVDVKFDFGNLIIGSISPGKLIARGTESQKIKFTSNAASPQPGDWGCIYFSKGASDDSIIEYAIVEYGGGEGLQDTVVSNIKIIGSSPTIKNCFIKNSLLDGIYISEYYGNIFQSDSTSEISGCRFEANGRYAIHIMDAAPVLDANEFINNGSYPISVGLNAGLHGPFIYETNTFSGNNPDQIRFFADLTYNYTLRYVGIPYYIPTFVAVSNDATLIIEPGVEMRFEVDTSTFGGLAIGTSSEGGKLIARGTESQKIKFTSNSQPLNWRGIVFTIKSSDESIIENAIIEYCRYSAIQINYSNPTIKKCVIRNNLDDGILIVSGNAEISCCNITNNNNGISVSISSNFPIFPTIINNNIFENISYGIQNKTPGYEVNAEQNWWGHASGPSGVAQGSGDPVSSGVDYDPWLTYISTCATPNQAKAMAWIQLLLLDD